MHKEAGQKLHPLRPLFSGWRNLWGFSFVLGLCHRMIGDMTIGDRIWKWLSKSEADVERSIRFWSITFAIVFWPLFAIVSVVERGIAAVKRRWPNEQ
jgi:hypothetical protein